MHPAIPHLIELQRVDSNITALRTEIDSYPKRVQEADARLSAARAAVAASKASHTEALKERKKYELDTEQWKERARKYRDQSGSVKTNEAYKALLHEIANAEAEAAKAEDRQLDVMMSGEEFERRVRHADADLKEAEASVAADRKEIHSRYDEKQKLLKAAQVERQQIAAPIPQDLLELYDRIAKRQGTAMAQVRDNQCRACGMRVLPHIVQELRQETNEEVYRCESCGRILYSLEPIPVAGPNPADGRDATDAVPNS